MELIVKLLLVMVITFFASLVISPLVITMIKKEKVKQVILHYVENHQTKAGTPTMGGIIFIVAISIVCLCFFDKTSSNVGYMTIIMFISFGLVGFIDDFIKFKFKRNMGLRAYQKIIFQLAISTIISIYAYKSNVVGSTLILPFSHQIVDIGWWIIPLNIVAIIATTNSVNLTDGLDGLAAGTTGSYLLGFVALIFVLLSGTLSSMGTAYVLQMNSLLIVAFAGLGAMLCYLVFNCYPAKIFMGDTGSLALGSLLISLAMFSRTTLYLPIMGIMFVLSSVSVILQVAYYKLTKKRIFLMAPLHHHFEKKGMHEVRITVMYCVITLIVCSAVVLVEMIV